MEEDTMHLENLSGSHQNGYTIKSPRRRYNSCGSASSYTELKPHRKSGGSRHPSGNTNNSSNSDNKLILHISLPSTSRCISVMTLTVVGVAFVTIFIGCLFIELDKIKPPGLFKSKEKTSHLSKLPPDVSWFSFEESLLSTVSSDAERDEIKTGAELDKHTLERFNQKRAAKESLRLEAHSTYKAALQLVKNGNLEKARRLLTHAVSLDPLNPDILNLYGEVIESTDIVLADHLFNQAIIVSPTHSKALVNMKRTSPLVLDLDSVLYHRIDSKRDMMYNIPETNPALRRLQKELYYKHIYHTVAIEGNSLNLYQTRSIIENRLVVGGKTIMEHNEVLGMDAALSYINSTLLNRIGDVSINDILEIHKRVLGYVDPVGAGLLRNTQVFVGEFIPPRPGEVQALMEEFINWLNSDDASILHPIRLAAIAHYKLVTIHPFYDGNGRTSRLLMNLILMHAGYPPVMVRVEEKLLYYQHLETANRGDIRPFVRFIAECTENTVDEYLAALIQYPTDAHTDLAQFTDSRFTDDGRTIILENDDRIDDIED